MRSEGVREVREGWSVGEDVRERWWEYGLRGGWSPLTKTTPTKDILVIKDTNDGLEVGLGGRLV